MMNKQEIMDQITFKDDLMFQTIMHEKDICQAVLEQILGIKIKTLTYPEVERPRFLGISSHAVRFDVYVEDEEGNALDIEMQKRDYGNLKLRARYYHAMLDAGVIEKGDDYRNMHRSYVIFFCDFNPFGGRRRVYHVLPRIAEELEVEYGDGSEKIFLCTKGDEADTPIEILQFLSYLKDSKPTNTLTEKIEERVRHWKTDKVWEEQYMHNNAWVADYKHEGRREGIEQANALHAAEEARFGKLLKLLRAAGRNEEALNAFEDKELRKRLYAEYGIE